jgi:hypothetical protein
LRARSRKSSHPTDDDLSPATHHLYAAVIVAVSGMPGV